MCHHLKIIDGLLFIGISERNFLIVVEAKRCGDGIEKTKRRILAVKWSFKQWITKTNTEMASIHYKDDSWILFSLDFGHSEFLRDPGDEVNTEWDPSVSVEQHSYYHLNPSESVSYRYSYDTGDYDDMTHFGTYQNPFIGWLPDGGRSFKWEERSVLGDVRGEYGCVID